MVVFGLTSARCQKGAFVSVAGIGFQCQRRWRGDRCCRVKQQFVVRFKCRGRGGVLDGSRRYQLLLLRRTTGAAGQVRQMLDRDFGGLLFERKRAEISHGDVGFDRIVMVVVVVVVVVIIFTTSTRPTIIDASFLTFVAAVTSNSIMIT